MDEPKQTEPTLQNQVDRFFTLLAGEAAGRVLSGWLTIGSFDEIMRETVKAEIFERNYKQFKTKDTMSDGLVKADPAYIGISELDMDLPFAEQFRIWFRPRLAARAESFDLIFRQLTQRPRPLIIETGCLRIPGNWAGDGQSTFLFDSFVRNRGGAVISIDITPESIESARRACSGATNLILNDSVTALYALSTRCKAPVDLVYLDSFDLDVANPMPSAVHHLKELAAIRPLIGPGTLVCVDDFCVPGQISGGKGMLIDQFMDSIRAERLFDGYQRVWRIPD